MQVSLGHRRRNLGFNSDCMENVGFYSFQYLFYDFTPFIKARGSGFSIIRFIAKIVYTAPLSFLLALKAFRLSKVPFRWAVDNFLFWVHGSLTTSTAVARSFLSTMNCKRKWIDSIKVSTK